MRKQLFNNIKKHLAENGHIFFSYSKRAQQTNPIENTLGDDLTYVIAAQEQTDDDDTHYIYDIQLKRPSC
jgi:hypothetical protein